MLASGLLQNPLVRDWLNGVQPAWTLLSAESFVALRREQLGLGGSLRLSEDLDETEVSGSAMVENTVILLQHALDSSGLKLTATGNLTRAVVAEMIPGMDWPAYDKADLYRFNKVINEPDFLPLHIFRTVAQGARLLRASQGRLVPIADAARSEHPGPARPGRGRMPW